MMGVVPPRDDSNGFARLRSSGMAKRIGPRVISNLVPRRYPTLTALQIATGIAYSTLHAWKKGTADPDIPSLEDIADKLGIDVADLLRGDVSRPRGEIRNHPEWPGAVSEAKARRPGKVRDYAYAFAGETSLARWPEHITWDWVYDLADFWFRHTTDEELARAETEQARREMAEEDAAIEAQLKKTAPANETPKRLPAPKKGRPRRKQ
jgi:transcriptional regulator with XRE-family HTH domain